MIKNAAYPVRCAVKKRWENYADKSLIHGAKVCFYFEFRMFNFEIILRINNLRVKPARSLRLFYTETGRKFEIEHSKFEIKIS